MQSLHESLKHQPSDNNEKPAASKSEDLGRRYRKIGISAVAAATQFHGTQEATTPSALSTPADRSSARGWSNHR